MIRNDGHVETVETKKRWSGEQWGRSRRNNEFREAETQRGAGDSDQFEKHREVSAYAKLMQQKRNKRRVCKPVWGLHANQSQERYNKVEVTRHFNAHL